MLPRPITALDEPALHAMNNEHSAELSYADERAFTELLARAAYASCLGDIGAPDAFVITFSHETPRQGPNHGWFLARRPRFLYVDRVCVAARARRRGLARALYEDVFREARARGIDVIGCEINTDIANVASDVFHERLGFVEVGRAVLAERNDKPVRYLECVVR